MKTVFRKLAADEATIWTGSVYVDVTGECDSLDPGEYAVTMSASVDAVRTIKQNNSIHLYSKLVADKFNDAGITKKMYFKKRKMEGSWTKESVLENVWRDIQEALFEHRKTSKLGPGQVTKVYNEISEFLSVRFKVDQSFPNRHGD
jgi:hypothetical protein